MQGRGDSASELPLFLFPRQAARPREGSNGAGGSGERQVRACFWRGIGVAWPRSKGRTAVGGRNGGAMNESKRVTEKAAKKNKVVTITRTDDRENAKETEPGEKKSAGKPRSGSAKETKPKESKKTAAQKPKKEECQGSKKDLRHWAKKVVKDNCEVITKELASNAKHGDWESTEKLLELMERDKKGGEGDDGLDGPSLAEQLMEGPTWEEVLEARRLAREEEEAAAAAS